MLNPFGGDSEAGSYFQLQKRLARRLKSAMVDQQIAAIARNEYGKALDAEAVVLALRLVFEDVTQQGIEGSEA